MSSADSFGSVDPPGSVDPAEHEILWTDGPSTRVQVLMTSWNGVHWIGDDLGAVAGSDDDGWRLTKRVVDAIGATDEVHPYLYSHRSSLRRAIIRRIRAGE